MHFGEPVAKFLSMVFSYDYPTMVLFEHFTGMNCLLIELHQRKCRICFEATTAMILTILLNNSNKKHVVMHFTKVLTLEVTIPYNCRLFTI